MRSDHSRTKLATRRMTFARMIFPAMLLAFLLAATTGDSFTALYAFGDSLSDTGRSPSPAQSYFNGRYSNGPLWVEYLSASLELSYKAANNFGSTTFGLQMKLPV